MKIWINSQKGEDRIIAHLGDTIYKCNPKANEVEQVAWGLGKGVLPDENMFGIPLSYISEIRWQEGKNYIQVFFRGSEEYFTVYDDTKRQEIFDYFKTLLPSFSTKTERKTAIQAGKKPLAALIVVGILCLVTLLFASTIESGTGYEFHGHGSLLVAVIGLASLGTKKVLLIFGGLLAIAGFSFARKAKHPPVIHRIIK
ncbi:hypothetical protein [Chitinophaga arvensicola]|nr:hypothetical protein [Chitinophaga arvensicola]